MNEFELIGKYFSPLAQGQAGAFGLTDDAAILDLPPTHSLVCTKDALTEKIHFFSHDAPDTIAKKLLGVNLSDLAAMGATPLAYLLALHLPRTTSSTWLEQFTLGLKEYITHYGGSLIGGDTITHDGPLCVSLTALGTVPKTKALLRSGAKPGDAIYVSGYIGDSYAGLCYLKQSPNNLLPALATEHYDYLVERYHHPIPRLELGIQLQDLATSCIDISDGLISDLGHLCNCSHTSAVIMADQIPYSDAVRTSTIAFTDLITGGDDYELLFTVTPEHEKLLPKLSNLTLTRIGYMAPLSEPQIILLDKKGNVIPLPKQSGYRHIIK